MSQLTISNNFIKYGPSVNKRFNTVSQVIDKTIFKQKLEFKSEMLDAINYDQLAMNYSQFIEKERNILLPAFNKAILKQVQLSHKQQVINFKTSGTSISKISDQEIEETLNRYLPDFKTTLKKINNEFIVDDVNFNQNNGSVNVDRVKFRVFFEYYKFEDPKILNYFTTTRENASRQDKIDALPHYIDIRVLAKFFLKIRDDYTLGKFHEYIPIHKLFFKYEDELERKFDAAKYRYPTTGLRHSDKYYEYLDRKNKYDSNRFISYTNICGVDSPFAHHFNIRFETQFDEWLFNKFKYHPLFGPNMDKIPIILQYKIDNQTKYNDGCIMDEILFEVQEADDNHLNNPNDDFKNKCAIKDNKIIVYYHQKANTEDDRAVFWNIIEQLVYGVLFEKYPETCIQFKQLYYFDRVFNEINNLTDEYNTTDNKTEKIGLKESIDELNDIFKINNIFKLNDGSNDHVDKLIRFFNWNEECYKRINDGKDPRIIDLYELLRMTSVIESDWSKIIQDYGKYMLKDRSNSNEIKYKINWETLINIVGDPLNGKQRTRKNLNRYLAEADLAYNQIIKMLLYGPKLYIKLTKEANLLDKNYAKIESDRMIASKTKTIVELRDENKLNELKIKTSIKLQIKARDVIERNNLQDNLNSIDKGIISEWIENIGANQDQIEIGSKSNKNTPIEICRTEDYNPLVIISGSKTRFPIDHSPNPKDIVSKEQLFAIFKDWNIPIPTRHNIIFHLVGRYYEYADMPASFNRLKINSLYVPKKVDVISSDQDLPINTINESIINVLNTEIKDSDGSSSGDEDAKNEFC